MSKKLTHLTHSGDAQMVDIGQKNATHRLAIAQGHIKMQSQTLALIMAGKAKKGDVLATARIAGIMAAKKTPELIPLCHPIILNKVTIEIIEDDTLPGLIIHATTKVEGKTGVEMEALTACSVACLTIYDMVKAVDRGMEIGPIKLLEKSGGKSGRWKSGDGKVGDGT